MKKICSVLMLFASILTKAETPLESLIHRAEKAQKTFEKIAFVQSANQQDTLAEKYARGYSLYDVSNAQLQQLLTAKSRNIELQLSLNGTDYTMKLTRVNLNSQNYKVTTSAGETITPNSNALFYQGIVSGAANSLATVSIFEDDVMVLFSTQEDGNFVLGKIGEASSQKYVLYNDANLNIRNDFHCSTDDATFNREKHTSSASRATNSNETHDCRALLMYYEVNYALYHNKRDSVLLVENFVRGMFNNIKAIYYNEYINVYIDEINIWTTADSYSTTSSNTALNQFTSAKGNAMHGRCGQLLCAGSMSLGGIAWLDVLCSNNRAVSFVGIGTSYSNFPTYSWNVEAATHELGHNIASPHTHGCYWNGNNTAIDGCAPTYDPSYAEGSCPIGPIPSSTVKGTIMSYCHLLGNVGINLSNGFGPQPGDLIRQAFTDASCITVQEPFSTALVLDTNTACAGGQIYMEVDSPQNDDSYSYNWYRNSTLVSSVTYSFNAQQSGAYYCVTTDSNGCQSTTAAAVLNFIAPNAQIEASAMPLCGSDSAKLSVAAEPNSVYLWSTGDFTSSIEITQRGTYAITVTDSFGCTATTTKTIDESSCTSGISESTIIDLTVFPNPTNDVLIVESAALASAKVQAVVYDITGKVVSLDVNKQGEKATLSTDILASGVYVLRLTIGEQTINHRFVKY